MIDYGLPLFRRSRALTRYMHNLRSNVYQTIGVLLVKEELYQDELLKKLDSLFTLSPLRPGELMWTMVDRHRTAYRDSAAGPIRSGFFVQGHVPYSGTKLLWQVSPKHNYKPPFRAKVGLASIKLCSFLDDENIASFTAAAVQMVDELQDVLHAFEPTIGAYNRMIRDELELQVRTY